MEQKTLNTIIESICKQGCQRTNEIIQLLECGKSVDEADQLSAAERGVLLAELKTIMAVYEKKR